MKVFIKKMLTAPVFDDEIKTHQAYLLHVVLWTLVCVPIPFIIYSFIQRTDNFNRVLIQAVSGEVINVILLFMLRKGYVRAVSIGQVSAFWIFFTAIAYTGSGVQSEAYLLGYGLVIAIAGILLGGTGAVLFTFLSLAFGGWMVFGRIHEIASSSFNNSPLTTWVVSLVLFPVGAVLQYLASRNVRNTLEHASANEEKYRLISRVSSDYTFTTKVHKDGSANLIWVAGAFEKMTGYSYEEYIANGEWPAHVHPDDLEKDALDMETLQKKQDIKSEIRTFAKNGEIRWERIFAHPVWDEKENRLTGIIGAVQDVTEQKRTEAALAHERDLLQIFMDNIPDQIYFKDAESRFVRINQTQARFLRINTPEDAIGKTDLDFQTPELAREFILEEKRIIETGQAILNRIEWNPTEDGTPRWLSTIKVPAKDESGQTIGIIGISRNITKEKIAEELEQSRRAMLENVIKLGQVINEVTDIDKTLENIWHGIHEGLQFDRLAIFLYNIKRNSLDRVLGTNLHGEMEKTPGMWFPLEERSTLSLVFSKPDGLFFTHNYDTENNPPENDEMYGVKDYAAVAVWSGDKPVAVISADRHLTGQPISDAQLESLRLFAGYAGLAIENARLNEKIQNELSQQTQAKNREEHRREILEKVIKLGQQATEVSDLRTTLMRIWHGIHDDLGFDRVGLFLYDAERLSMNGTFGTNNQGEMTDEWDTSFFIEESSQDSRPFLQALKKPDTIFLTHSYEDEYHVPEGHIMSGVKDHALIGAWSGEKPMAIISVDHRITGRSITEEQLEALRLFAGYAGLAIENSRLNTTLQDELAQRGEILLKQSAILNGIPDMAWLKDKDSRYIAINEQFAKTAGMKMEEIRGKTDFDIWQKNYAEKYRDDDLAVMQSYQRKNTEELQTDSAGNEYWVETTKTPIRNASGEVTGTVGIAREITERKRARESEQQRRMMLEKVVQLGKRVTEADSLRSTIKKIWHGVHDDLGFNRLAIFLFNPEKNTMNDTVGTNNAGEMIDHWDLSFPIDSTFASLLQNPNGFYFTHNYDVENKIPKEHEMYGVKDYVAIAAWAGDKPVAVICADNGITHHSISDEQLEALRLFGGYAGLAIENSRLSEAVQKELTHQKLAKERERERRATLEKIIKLGQYVTEVTNLRTTLTKIWNGIHHDLGFDRLAIFFYDPVRKSMDGTFGTNNQGEMTDEWHISHSMITDENPDSQPFFHVLEKPDTIYITRNFEEDYNIPPGTPMSGVKDFASIAAWAGDKPVAFISVDHNITHRPITDEQLEALRLFAGYAGLAIENARLSEKIQNELAQQIQSEEREKHRRAILEKVVKLGQHVTEVNDLRTTLIRIWHGVHDDLGFDRLGIRLYNPERKSMDGTFGTNNQGEMIDEWNEWISLEEENPESNSLLYVLEKPENISFTHTFEDDYNIPVGQNMSGVKEHAAIAAWAGNKPVAIISVDHRITGRPIAEEQLEALRLFAGYAGLAIENARLNSALENELAVRKNFIVELEAKNAELERFTYTVSHDLKSPLVTIRGFLGYLERDAQQGDYEKFRHDTQRIEIAVEKMQNLLRDLLELSRIGRLINPPVNVSFDEIVKDALEIVHGQIEEKNIAIEYKENNLIVRCDRVRLTEAVQNLLDNATKFMGNQPNPKIEVGFLKNKENETIFYVKDNGIGIAAEFHENIFGLFNKLESNSSGTGIGLALVKRIIEVHGGRIWIESKVDEGSTFYFTLPQ